MKLKKLLNAVVFISLLIGILTAVNAVSVFATDYGTVNFDSITEATTITDTDTGSSVSVSAWEVSESENKKTRMITWTLGTKNLSAGDSVLGIVFEQAISINSSSSYSLKGKSIKLPVIAGSNGTVNVTAGDNKSDRFIYLGSTASDKKIVMSKSGADTSYSSSDISEGFLILTTSDDFKIKSGPIVLTEIIPASTDPSASLTCDGEADESGAYTVVAGETLQLTGKAENFEATEESYTSSNKAVATVDGNGLVTGVSAGEATITYTAKDADNNQSATLSIKVVAAVKATGITIENGESASVYLGEELSLTAILEPEGANETVVWSSDDETVATVDQNGKVKALTVGSATITATVGKLNAVITVTVKDFGRTERSITFSKDSKSGGFYSFSDSVASGYLKMDSSATLEFTPSKSGKLFIVYSTEKPGKTVTLNGTVIETESLVTAGTKYTIKRNSKISDQAGLSSVAVVYDDEPYLEIAKDDTDETGATYKTVIGNVNESNPITAITASNGSKSVDVENIQISSDKAIDKIESTSEINEASFKVQFESAEAAASTTITLSYGESESVNYKLSDYAS